MANKNITQMPYAKWLEQTLRDILALPVRSIAITAVMENDDTYVDYYKCSMSDKLMFAGLINQDAMLDNLAALGVIKYEDEEGVDGETEE